MNKVLGINFFVFCLLSLVIVLYFSREIRNEGFFDSTGALVQLASTEGFDDTGALTQLSSTRVVSKREQDVDDEIQNNLTRQGIMNMTESGYNGSDYASTGAMY